MTLQTNEKRLLDNLHTLRTFTDTPQDGVTRFSYGTQDARAREYIIKRAENCGCSVSIDALQNIRIGLPTNHPGRKTVLSGSHIDTVRNGGWLDGIYGVCGALEVLETLAENPDSLKDTSFNYELVVFAEEEGSGFGSTMTGSKFTFTELQAGIICLSLNCGAYMAEIIRAGIESVDKGQMEAARSLGLSYWKAMAKVVLPQAIRTMIPSIINQFIITLKDTSILSVIGFPELVNTAKNVVANTMSAFQVWSIVALMYLIVITLLSRLAKRVERRLNRGRQ